MRRAEAPGPFVRFEVAESITAPAAFSAVITVCLVAAARLAGRR